MQSGIQFLNLPEWEPKEFKRNLIKLAVCELRFPTLLELEEKHPTAFQKSIRKEYPHFETRQNYEIKPGFERTEIIYMFISKDKKWTVSLKPSSLSLETTNYSSFSDFKERLEKVITDDFKNKLISEELIATLQSGKYGKAELFGQEVFGHCKKGKYSFRHGIQRENPNEYILDFDFYEENVEIADTFELLQNLHRESLKLFGFAVGDRAIKYMLEEDNK